MAKDPFLYFFRGVRCARYFIVVFWLGMIGVGVWRAPKLFDKLQVIHVAVGLARRTWHCVSRTVRVAHGGILRAIFSHPHLRVCLTSPVWPPRLPSLDRFPQDVLAPSASSPSAIAKNTFRNLGLCASQSSVVLAQSLGDYDVVNEDGYIENLFSRLQGNWGYYGGMSLWTVNSTSSGLGVPVEMAVPLFLSADGKSTIMKFNNFDWLPQWIDGTLSWMHTETSKYFVAASGPSALSRTDSSGVQRGVLCVRV